MEGGYVSKQEIRNYLWQAGDLRFLLDPLQRSILDTVSSHYSVSKKICLLSSRQIGKSYWAVVFVCKYLISNPGKIARIIAPTREKAQEIVEDILSVVLASCPPGLVVKSAQLRRWNFANGSSLRIGAGERQYADGNRGGNASLIVYEEPGFLDSADLTYLMKSVINAQLLRSNGHEIFVTSPSEDPEHVVHTEILPEAEAAGTAFCYNVFESPSIRDENIAEAIKRSGCKIGNNTPAELKKFVEDIRSVDNKDYHFIHKWAEAQNFHISDHFYREYMAFIIRPLSLMVVPRFNKKVVVQEFTLWTEPVQITIDWGGVRDKTAALMHYYSAGNDLDLIYDEIVFEPNTPTNQIVNELKEWEHTHKPGVEIRRADVFSQTQIDLNVEHGYTVSLPQKTRWLSAVTAMSSRIALEKVKIHPRCKFLIKSIEKGKFNKQRNDFQREASDAEDSLGHCDALAALMYALQGSNLTGIRQNNARNHPMYGEHFLVPTAKKDTLSMLTSGKRFGKFK